MILSDESAPHLLVPIGNGIHASVDAAPAVSMAHGELSLHVHGTLHIHIEPIAMLVTGCISSPR
jgi:hypothetical protein